MTTNSERRRAKLIGLCDKHGLYTIAKQADLNPLTLEQVINGALLPPKKDGTRSPRSLGDVAARAIEDAQGLSRGWFDMDDSQNATKPGFTPEAMALAKKFDEVKGVLSRSEAYIAAHNSIEQIASRHAPAPTGERDLFGEVRKPRAKSQS